MAFWGVFLEPQKPYIHTYDDKRGRLQITQATLEVHNASDRSVVRCNVGGKSPILLCSLIPNISESCSLELEIEKHRDMVFLVLGANRVYLSGYFLLKESEDVYESDDASSSLVVTPGQITT
ncbi:hypothetical protein J5N97_010257 [Dioscorea zingiberensis]|uniref:Nucleoplasmin-like domain-containing protein n=1 Tax=Dioscorea zingiberensis TaxID=325984 RepID=A0A9D5D0B7_9LILI|nr:hypothetical protein J5N97_010257 [Dioscorea zingiberensis]